MRTIRDEDVIEALTRFDRAFFDPRHRFRRRFVRRGAVDALVELEASVGDTVTLTVLRDGQQRQLDITLAARPAN